LHTAGQYLDYLRVHNYSPQTIYGVGKMLRYFRVFCEQDGITQARQVTRTLVLDYQTHLAQYRKKLCGTSLAVGTQQHWLILNSAV
jgi:site-specific recombinase XerD